MSLRLFIAWYDLWVGAYWNRERRRLYICPLPCVCLMIQFRLSAAQRFLLQLEPREQFIDPEERP